MDINEFQKAAGVSLALATRWPRAGIRTSWRP